MISIAIIAIFIWCMTVCRAKTIERLRESKLFTAAMFALYMAAIVSVLTL